MMIRSAPPASAHLAESPVPAPAPMIGFPASTCPRRRASASALVIHHLMEPVRHRVRERRVVDVEIELVQLDVVAEVLPQRREERLVRGGVVERPALGR